MSILQARVHELNEVFSVAADNYILLDNPAWPDAQTIQFQNFLSGLAGNTVIGTVAQDFILTAPVDLNLQTTGGDIVASPVGDVILTPGSGLVGIGTASPEGTLHIYVADSTVVPNASGDELFIEGTGDVGLTLASLDTGRTGIWSGFPIGNSYHRMLWYGPSHATLPGTMEILVANNLQLYWTTGSMEFQRPMTLSTTATNNLSLAPGGNISLLPAQGQVDFNNSRLTNPSSGDTASRPGTPTTGEGYWDTDFEEAIWYDGAKWVNNNRSEHVRLAAALSPAATSATLDVIPGWAISGSTWAVIDAGTTEAEARLVTVSGQTISWTGGLTYSHSTLDEVILLIAPIFYAEMFGARADGGTTNNKVPIDRAIAQVGPVGGRLRFGTGDYYVEFSSGSPNDAIIITDSIIIEGAGRTNTTFSWGPDDAAFPIRGFKVDASAGANYEFRDFKGVPPAYTNLQAVNFDDLEDWTLFWWNPNGVHSTILAERIDTDQGYETVMQISGDGSLGFDYTVRNSVFKAYSVPVAGATTGDYFNFDIARKLTLHDCDFYSHLGEGNSTWDTRGRVVYVHPNFSVSARNLNLYGSGSGRPQFAMYSSGAVGWESAPPKYVILDNVTFHRPAGAPDTEALQTTNLIGVTTMITNSNFYVNEIAARVRGNTIFENCHFAGETKSISAEQVGPLKSYLSVAADSPDTVITVQDASLWADTDPIIIRKDDGTLHTTTVSGAPSGNNITLAAAIDGPAAINSWVVRTITQSGSNATTAEWFKINNCHFENDPFPDAMIVGDSRVKIFVTNTVFDLNSLGSGVQVYQSLLADSEMFFYGCTFNGQGLNKAYVAEMLAGELSVDFCTFTGDFNDNAVFDIRLGTDKVRFNNNTSHANAPGGAPRFFTDNGSLPINKIEGEGNKFWGNLKPWATNAQNLSLPRATDPTTIAQASTTNIPWTGYDTFNITGTGDIVTLLLGGQAAIQANMTGTLRLKAVDGFTLRNNASHRTITGENFPVAAGTFIDLYRSSDEAIWIQTSGTYPASGGTSSRPTAPNTGTFFFDTDLSQPLWYDGTNWVDADGNTV